MCDLNSVLYLWLDLSSMPKEPYYVPQTTLRPSGLISTLHTVPSCFASMKNSEKSKGHTLRYVSSLPVTQKASLTAIEWIALSFVW